MLSARIGYASTRNLAHSDAGNGALPCACGGRKGSLCAVNLACSWSDAFAAFLHSLVAFPILRLLCRPSLPSFICRFPLYLPSLASPIRSPTICFLLPSEQQKGRPLVRDGLLCLWCAYLLAHHTSAHSMAACTHSLICSVLR